VIAFRKIVEGCDECGAIVGYDFIEGSPSAYDIFKDPISDSFSSFVA
jgi:hypothetical protein